MTTSIHRWNSSFIQPDDLFKICDTTAQYCVLSYLIQLNNGYQHVFVSQETLRMKKNKQDKHALMSKPTVDEAVDALVAKGFIKRIKHDLPKANEYIICEADINNAIDCAQKGIHRRSDGERKAMARHMANMYPDEAREALVNGHGDAIYKGNTGEKVESRGVDNG